MTLLSVLHPLIQLAQCCLTCGHEVGLQGFCAHNGIGGSTLKNVVMAQLFVASNSCNSNIYRTREWICVRHKGLAWHVLSKQLHLVGHRHVGCAPGRTSS